MKTYRVNARNPRKLFSFLLTLVLSVVTLVFPSGSSLRAEEGLTVANALDEVVSYYQEGKTELNHWEELVALRTAGVDLHDGSWQLPAWGSSATEDAGYILGLLARGDDPGCAWSEQRNLLTELANKQQEDGSFGGSLNNTVWAMIALDKAGGAYDTEKAVEYLLSRQDTSGGFGFWGGPEPDDTGMALQALSNHREKDGVNEAVYSSLDYLTSIQLPSAGFASWGTENANSIATVISGLTAVNEDLADAGWVKGGKTMIDALLTFKLDDDSFYYAITDWSPEAVTDDMATRQALKALADLAAAGYGDLVLTDGVSTPVDIRNSVINYFRESKTELDHWEELVALRTAEVDLHDGSWQLPAWGSSATEDAGYILGLLARGDDPGCAWSEQRNLLTELINKQQEDGSFEGSLNNTVWAIIALDKAGGVYDAEKAVEYLLSEQDTSGGFGFWGGSEPDDTGMALQALSNHREKEGVNEAVYDSLDYLANIQLASAGFASWGTENANSIATVISGLTAVNEDLTDAGWVKGGKTMVDALLTFKLDDDSFYYAITDWSPEAVTDDMATRQALKALADLVAAGYGDVLLYEQVAVPVATPQAGQVDRGTSVSLSSATPGATIYYTTDGSIPTTDSSAYAVPLIISDDLTINAIAVKENMHDSNAVTFNYTIRGTGGSPPETITVSVSIIGKNAIHFNGNVIVSNERANALEALKMTGISYQTRDNDAYVLQIAGEREDLATTAGWKYKVNNIEPGTAAKNYSIKNGDNVVWFWVDDVSQNGGGSVTENPDSNTEINNIGLTAENFSDIMAQTMSGIKQLREMFQSEVCGFPVEITVGKVVVVSREEAMPDEEKEELRRLLDKNFVNIRRQVMQGGDALVNDETNEITLKVGAGALPESKDITVDEVETDAADIISTHNNVSPLYRFGPEGTVFAEPVLLSIRLAIPADIAPEDLVLAWFDEERQQWFALPTVVDLARGFISAEISHFTDFAVLVRKISARTFADVSAQSHSWAAEQISYLATRGIIKGMSEGFFEPDRLITRAEFTTLVVNALDLDTEEPSGSGKASGQLFADVRPEDWFAPYVKAAVAACLVRGVDKNLFEPQEPMTREQMAVMLSRAFAADFQEESDPAFPDAAEISPWARIAMKKILARDLLQGFDDGNLKPAYPVTRAQGAVVIYRLLLE